MLGHIATGPNGNQAKKQVQHNGSSQEKHVYAGMAVAPERKAEKRVVAFCQPEQDHPSQQDNEAVGTGNMRPVMDKLVHMADIV